MRTRYIDATQQVIKANLLQVPADCDLQITGCEIMHNRGILRLYITSPLFPYDHTEGGAVENIGIFDLWDLVGKKK